MGGHIWLESEEGRGSKFSFTVKVRPASSGAVQEVEERVEGARVVIVDDSESHLRFLRRVLRRWGMTPMTARNGEEAVALCDDVNLKAVAGVAVLLDADLAAGDAPGLARRMRSAAKMPLPVILLARNPLEAEQRELSTEAGIVRTVLKPYRRSALLEALQEALGASGGRQAPGIELAGVQKATQRKLRILLVEDNEMNQRLIARILEKMGHEVAVADDGRKALEVLSRREFDLVAMDMQMPVMDGLETTREIRSCEARTGRHIAIVAMTANAFEEDRRKCFDAGMDGYVVKPVSVEAVRKEIDRVMSKAEVIAGREAVPEGRQ